eukprot:TRINITY_DN8090_c0_g1_i1.p1 TRINITY_DN8090_c0_g1~~TRINITY_DN8090_c0_g1_i1.p1  ORF type:complete len:351 (-),score=15.65 TRINITY_DN8090_c0_g1_i1:137-1108(-)
MTSGICFMLSKSPLWLYQLRLFVVFAVGVGANWTADIVTGRDWRGNFGDTIFQMAYVAALIVLGVLSAPLRLGFKEKWSGTESIKVRYVNAALAVFYFACTVYALVCMFQGLTVLPVFNEPFWEGKSATFKHNSTVIVATLFGTLFLCSLASYLGHNDLLGWILLGYVYVPAVIIPFKLAGFPHNVQLYLVGAAIEYRHLRGRQALNKFIRAYWPMCFAVCLLLSMPTMLGRCDLNPPNTYWERFRFYFVELALALALLSGALESGDPYGATGWLCKWALYAYCCHVAWARLLDSPWGAVISYSSLILFYAGHRLAWARRSHV